MKFRWAYLLGALVLALGMLLAAACGGGEEGEEEAGPSPERATEVVEEEAEEEKPTREAEEEEEPELAEPSAAFADLKSYRYLMRFDIEGTSTGQEAFEGTFAFDLNVEGAFVAPDREQVKVTGSMFGLELEEETIRIGDRTWVHTDGGWVEGEAEFTTEDFSPASFAEAFNAEDLRILKPSKETINGIRSLRYKISKANIEKIAGFAGLFGEGAGLEDLPENFDIDLWLAEDGGWPVRLVMSASGDFDGVEGSLDLSMDVTDVNDESIEIEPPS